MPWDPLMQSSAPVGDPVAPHFEALLAALKEHKPQDRSAKDRAYAVTITEVEKAMAYFLVYGR